MTTLMLNDLLLLCVFSALVVSGHSADPLGASTAVRAPVYSILADPRAVDWPSSLSGLSGRDGSTGFLATKYPVLNVTLSVDLADPEDLSMVDLLFYRPLPMTLEIVPVWDSNSVASQILGRCFDTIFTSETDLGRVRDFLRALDEWTWEFKKPEKWARVNDRAASLACQVFTKNITAAREIIDSVHVQQVETEVLPSIYPSRTAIVNGMRLENVTAETLFPFMIRAQQEYLSVHDEL